MSCKTGYCTVQYTTVLFHTMHCGLIEAHFSPQAASQIRRQNEGDGAEPPEPPPLPPPENNAGSDDDDDKPDAVEGKSLPIVPSNKSIQVFKHHCKVSIESEFRKFENKIWGPAHVTLAVAETFRKQTLATLSVFDGFKRKPTDRQNMLTSAGCDPKFSKASIANQKEALIRRICKGKVALVEGHLVDCVVKLLANDVNTTGWVLSSTLDDNFKASFTGGKHHVEKIFPKATAAVDWLKSMTIAEKARGVVQSIFSCL